MNNDNFLFMNDFLDPDKILDNLILWPDMQAADFGCGSGGWTIPLSKRLRKGEVVGLVYGVDVLDAPLSALESKARLEKISNIKTVKTDLEKGCPFGDNSMDVVLATNIFFQMEDKSQLLGEIKRVLKPNGQALVVDWLDGTALSPKQGGISASEAREMVKKAGFRVRKEFGAGKWHWGMLLIKN